MSLKSLAQSPFANSSSRVLSETLSKAREREGRKQHISGGKVMHEHRKIASAPIGLLGAPLCADIVSSKRRKSFIGAGNEMAVLTERVNKIYRVVFPAATDFTGRSRMGSSNRKKAMKADFIVGSCPGPHCQSPPDTDNEWAYSGNGTRSARSFSPKPLQTHHIRQKVCAALFGRGAVTESMARHWTALPEHHCG